MAQSCSRGSGEGKVWGEKGRRIYSKTLKTEKAFGVEKHAWACVIPSSLSLSSLLLCLCASIFWNSTAIAWRLVDITGCPAPLLISSHTTCPLSPKAQGTQGKTCQERPWPYSSCWLWPFLHHVHFRTSLTCVCAAFYDRYTFYITLLFKFWNLLPLKLNLLQSEGWEDYTLCFLNRLSCF